MQNKRVRRMKYMKEFRCIGSSCTDNCCIGWDVDIDIETFNRYKEMKDSPLVDRFTSDVIRNKDSYDETIDYGKMILKKNKRCPFLATDELCDIQRTHGEELLSKVCNAYPRIVNQVNGVYELSATLSCPEIARLVLLNPDSLIIEEEQMDSSRFIITQQVETKDENLHLHPAKYFNELRNFAMDLIRDTTYSLFERIQILGDVHSRILPLHSGGNLDAIPHELKKAKKQIENRAYDTYLRTVKASYSDQLSFFSEETQVLDDDKQINNQTFGIFLSQAKRGLAFDRSKNTSKSKSLYKIHAKSDVEPFIEEHEKLFENYILNTMFKSMYPFSEQGDPYAGYTMLVVRLFFIKAILIGLSADGQVLTPLLVTDVIQSYTKTLEHHKTFMNEILHYLMESGSDDLSYLSKLL